MSKDSTGGRMKVLRPDSSEAENRDKEKADVRSALAPCYASRFFRMQLVKFPLGDGTYQQCWFIGVDSHGVATVKTQGGRYRTVWDCNLYPVHNANGDARRETHPKRSDG